MKTILDKLVDKGKLEGKLEGKIEGKVETIQTVASLRFQETSKRLTSLLPKLNDLNLLDLTCKFALTASSLFDVENFVENLLQVQSKAKRVA